MTTNDLPNAWDWRDHDRVAPIKNQLGCSSSYIFAAIGAIEGRMMVRTNSKLAPFSEQEVLNCLPDNATYRRGKCSGGTEVEVFEYAKTFGVSYDTGEVANRSYTGKVASCPVKKGEFNIVDFYRVPPNSVADLKAAIIHRGPVTAVIDTTPFKVLSRVTLPSDFIIDDTFPCSETGSGNEAVLIVGYSGDTFFVRTSWGKDFADGGYLRIRTSANVKGPGTCGVLNRSFIPIIRNDFS